MEGEGNSRRDVYCTVNVGTAGTEEGRLREGGEGESGVKKKRTRRGQTDRQGENTGKLPGDSSLWEGYNPKKEEWEGAGGAVT